MTAKELAERLREALEDGSVADTSITALSPRKVYLLEIRQHYKIPVDVDGELFAVHVVEVGPRYRRSRRV